ncbi:hypothetical protein PRIPAC_77170 [Pristionchus pacificus]|uniref:G protein-coupled receptor n=1 Tax=Pristionchus pacificus TaxID=54126 RepID=A0A2A6CM44_PRIPA|nr:hypothetical protein PRIPAC_77170 [Pristionchus pacificus]|eukprot:PDM79123.1 G protein-coupled receptor [Pristionchus pacificus]
MAQYQFMPTMLLGPAYKCNAVMTPGQAWAEKYGKKQIPFGIYSLIFGIVTEIMFCLSFLDMFAIMVNCVIFGYLLLEYVNWPHAVHNNGVTCIVLVVKSRALYSTGSAQRLIKNMPVNFIVKYFLQHHLQIFAQAMLISCVNLVAASIYVFMNFIPVPPSVIVLGHVCWQISHGSLLQHQSDDKAFTTTHGSAISLQHISTY